MLDAGCWMLDAGSYRYVVRVSAMSQCPNFSAGMTSVEQNLQSW